MIKSVIAMSDRGSYLIGSEWQPTCRHWMPVHVIERLLTRAAMAATCVKPSMYAKAGPHSVWCARVQWLPQAVNTRAHVGFAPVPHVGKPRASLAQTLITCLFGSHQFIRDHRVYHGGFSRRKMMAGARVWTRPSLLTYSSYPAAAKRVFKRATLISYLKRLLKSNKYDELTTEFLSRPRTDNRN